MELLKGKENIEKAKSLDVAEEAREQQMERSEFCWDLFTGKVNWRLLFPFPEQSDSDKKSGMNF